MGRGRGRIAIDSEQQLAQFEQLFNVVNALRPDLTASELYELAVSGLADLSTYSAVALWLRDATDQLQFATATGLTPAQRTMLRSSAFDVTELTMLRAACQSLGEAFWWDATTQMPAAIHHFASLVPPNGHVLLMPMSYTTLTGVVALAQSVPTPAPEQVAFTQRCVDQIGIALTTVQIVTEHVRTQAQLQTALDQQDLLVDTIAELSTPVLPLVAGVLLVPLIGNVDHRRMTQLTDMLLDEISRSHAKVALIDITGVPIMDTHVTAVFLQLAQATALMGCSVVLVGIRPEIAQTLVGLGINFDEITTRGTLSDGLTAALETVRLKVVRKG